MLLEFGGLPMGLSSVAVVVDDVVDGLASIGTESFLFPFSFFPVFA